MTRVSINGPLPPDIGTGFAEIAGVGIQQKLSSCYPGLVRKTFHRAGMGPNIFVNISYGEWSLDKPQGP